MEESGGEAGQGGWQVEGGLGEKEGGGREPTVTFPLGMGLEL